MPVVVITAPEKAQSPGLAATVADAMATALGLGGGDVIAMMTPVTAVARSGGGEPGAWIVVTAHGSRREERAMSAALGASERAVRVWAADASVEVEGVWTEWIVP